VITRTYIHETHAKDKTQILHHRVLNITQVELAEPLGKAIGEPASNLLQNVPFIVVTKCSCNFVIGHCGTISVFPPQGSKGLGVVESKESLLLVLP